MSLETNCDCSTRQEVPLYGVGLVDGIGASQAQFGHHTVLEGSGGPFHTSLDLGRAGKYLLDAQFGNGFTEMSGLHRRLDVPGVAGKLEHAVAVSVKADGLAAALDRALYQDEVAAGVRLGTKQPR